MIEGVDLYEGNAFTPAAGVDFVFLKATEGRTLRDTAFAARWPQLAAMGKVRGCYHFPNFANAPATDFAFFASVVGPVLGAGDLVALDFEAAGDAHTWAQRTAWKNEFLALAKARWPNNRVGMYCDLGWWFGTDDNCGDFLWIADYGTKGAPRVQHPWTFQQYSTTGGVDHDVYNGTLAQLKAWAGAPAAAAMPAPAPAPAAAPTVQEDTMPVFATGQMKDGFACNSLGAVVLPAYATMLTIPPPDAGALPWGEMWLSLGCDFAAALVRVAIHDGQAWSVETVTLDPTAPRQVVAQLPVNAGKISLCRIPLSPGDGADSTPIAWLIEAGAR